MVRIGNATKIIFVCVWVEIEGKRNCVRNVGNLRKYNAKYYSNTNGSNVKWKGNDETTVEIEREVCVCVRWNGKS